MNAAYFYIVRYWVAPEVEARLLAWLDGGHTAEVVAQPGFLWARRARLQETDSLGWRAFTTIYGLESKAALDAYFRNPIREKFAREGAAFADVMRSERSWGAQEFETARR
jgi:antibiotic biosynthesis monooxygenase (ABM) superfamily enzyme